MKNYITLFVISATLLGLSACGDAQEKGIDNKKSQLREYKQEARELQTKIEDLEKEIAAVDPNFTSTDRNATLVTVSGVENETFEHFVEVRGSVTSRRNVTISAQTPAMVRQVKVEEGTSVKKGELLLLQDAETITRNIEELNTSLELAETRFKRQANLWEKNIGTEFQYLEAKNAKESLERKLASLNSQLNNYYVRAPFNGTIDEIFIKEGEMAQPGMPLLRLVSLTNMYIKADVSESFLGEFKKGDSVVVQFPSLNKSINSVISSVGQVINENNRTFRVEVRLPDDETLLRPNLMAVLKLKDFEQDNALIVPTNLILNDQKGDFVYVAEQAPSGNGFVAKKKHIERGKTYNNMTMVKSGLEGEERLITEGFRDVAEGVSLRISGQVEGVAMKENKALSANQ
ncbi:MAG: efflux RND transporter periplasmic adaptor subunit [Cyclobacteriaceae bacterium]